MAVCIYPHHAAYAIYFWLKGIDCISVSLQALMGLAESSFFALPLRIALLAVLLQGLPQAMKCNFQLQLGLTILAEQKAR